MAQPSQRTDRALLTYKENAPSVYLDGRYFNIIFGKNPNVPTRSLIVQVRLNSNDYVRQMEDGSADIQTNSDQIYINPTQNYVLLRVVIVLVGQRNPSVNVSPKDLIARGATGPSGSLLGNEEYVISRHSNLLIFDNNRKQINRFEPLDDNGYSFYINQKLESDFRYVLPQHTYQEIDFHPQPKENLGLCVGYVIKLAYFYVMGFQATFTGEGDIVRFSLYIEKLYKNRLRGKPDIEFGFGRGVGGGALLGGTVGGLAGGIAGGPAGAVTGLALGGLTGAALGGLASSQK